jgi:hypothetical protein
MKYLMSTLLAAAVALSVAPVSSAAPQGADIEASTRLTMKECLTMQAAKHDGASRAEMKKACMWTLDSDGSERPSASVSPLPVNSTPYGTSPSAGAAPLLER